MYMLIIVLCSTRLTRRIHNKNAPNGAFFCMLDLAFVVVRQWSRYGHCPFPIGEFIAVLFDNVVLLFYNV